LKGLFNGKDWKTKTKPGFSKDSTISNLIFSNIDECGLTKDIVFVSNFNIESNEIQSNINVLIYNNSALKDEVVLSSPIDSLEKNFNNYIKINRINDSIYVGELQYKVHRREFYSRHNPKEINTFTLEKGEFSIVWKK
jgi:hypothetical protein